MFDETDPRAQLASSTRGAAAAVDRTDVDHVQCFELAGLAPDDVEAGRPDQWSVRGATFVVTYVTAAQGDSEPLADVRDESILVVEDPSTRLLVSTASQDVEITEPSVVIIPPGAHTITAQASGTYVRVVPDHAVEGTPTARNEDFYADPRPGTDPVPPALPEGSTGDVVVHPLSTVHPEAGRFGRIFRSRSLMVNLLEPESGPRDTDKLSPHHHNTFEQCSVTLHGDYVHHLRVPWTKRLSQWRDDEHLRCSSPSITIIPPGMIHTTRSVGEGHHLMMDVFAPARDDFLAMSGWVLNTADYPPGDPS